MEVEAFRAEAEAFDQRVQRIRAEQDAKQRELEAAVGSSRVEFLNAVTPVLARLMIDSGAAVILERRQVFLAVGLVEITDEAIAAIDAQIGDGLAAPSPDAAPDEAEAPPFAGEEATSPESGSGRRGARGLRAGASACRGRAARGRAGGAAPGLTRGPALRGWDALATQSGAASQGGTTRWTSLRTPRPPRLR
jgi:hypothetical protein